MKIVVLNGSPKGDVSVTRQYVLYLEKAFPQHRFVVLHVAQQSRKLEADAAAFDAVIDEVRSADGVIWAFPLYILLVSSQYKRFIELIAERRAGAAFYDTHAVTLSTSINYHDWNAHVYMRSVCEDLGMRFVGIYSARMNDILKQEERRRLHLFAEDFFASIASRMQHPRISAVLPLAAPGAYRAVSPVLPAETRGRKIVILTDVRDGQESLREMAARLATAWGDQARVVNLYDFDIKGGCQGCLRCGAAYRCAYTGKDGFIDFYNSVLVPADIIVFAGTVASRQLSWKWREFFDRSFFNTHTPSLVGKQFAFLVSGPLSLLPELREIYEAWAELQHSNLVAFVSDEAADSRILDAALDQLAQRLVRCSEAAYIRPMTFLGVAGMKIFRDDIWSELRVVFRAHRILMGLAWFVTGLPLIRSRFPSLIRTQMVIPMRRAAVRGAS
jgi:multimeric flavodoxin WrbA